MLPTLLTAYAQLVRFEHFLLRRDFQGLYQVVRNQPVNSVRCPRPSVEQICRAVDMACVWYWRRVLCLQRSAVTVCLLKRAGIRACLVIGVQQTPFRAHAWVEIDGRVVNDREYLPTMYSILDRC